MEHILFHFTVTLYAHERYGVDWDDAARIARDVINPDRSVPSSVSALDHQIKLLASYCKSQDWRRPGVDVEAINKLHR